MKNTKYLIVAIFGVIGSLFTLIQNAGALGISPSPIVRDNVANGMRMEEHVRLLRSSSVGDAHIEVTLNGEGARYLEFSDKIIIIPDGQKSIDYKFYISPVNAPNGKHEALVVFIQKSVSKITGAGASVQEGIASKVIFNVVDHEVKSYQIFDVKFENTELGLPLIFSFYFSNTGNVDVRPDRVELAMVDVTDDTNVFKKTFGQSDIEIVPPGGRKEFTFSMDPKLPQGEYNVSALFYINNVEIYRVDNLLVKILPPGSLGQGAEFSTFISDKPQYSQDELAEITGILENTGSIALNSAFITEVYKNDKRTDILRSKDKIVLKGQKGNFSNNYRFTDSGEYKLKGYFEYGSNKTADKELIIVVGGGAGNTSSVIIITILIIIILIISVFVIKYILKHKKNNIEPPLS